MLSVSFDMTWLEHICLMRYSASVRKKMVLKGYTTRASGTRIGSGISMIRNYGASETPGSAFR